jgi:hypothetical protein
MDTLIVKSRAVRRMLNRGQKRLRELPSCGRSDRFMDSRSPKAAIESISRHTKRGLGKNIENKAAP